MCLIIASDGTHERPSDKMLVDAWLANPDGGGVAWVEKGNVRIERTMDLDIWMQHVEHAWAQPGPCMLHVRWSTGGTLSAANAHPFGVHGQAIAHNGHMSWITPYKGWSDTRTFVYDTLEPIGKDFARDERLRDTIEHLLGGDRLAVLLPEGKLELFGEWHEHETGMHSNLSAIGGKLSAARPKGGSRAGGGWTTADRFDWDDYLATKEQEEEDSDDAYLVPGACYLCSGTVDLLSVRCIDCCSCLACMEVSDCSCTSEELDAALELLEHEHAQK